MVWLAGATPTWRYNWPVRSSDGEEALPSPDSLANLMYLKLADVERLWGKRKLHGFVQYSDELMDLWKRYDKRGVKM